MTSGAVQSGEASRFTLLFLLFFFSLSLFPPPTPVPYSLSPFSYDMKHREIAPTDTLPLPQKDKHHRRPLWSPFLASPRLHRVPRLRGHHATASPLYLLRQPGDAVSSLASSNSSLSPSSQEGRGEITSLTSRLPPGPDPSHLDDRGCPDASGIHPDPAAILICGEDKGCIPHLPTQEPVATS